MKKAIRYVLLFLLLLLATYFTWSSIGRNPTPSDNALHLDSTYVIQEDAGKGNIVGISPYMIPADYSSKKNFRSKLEAYLEAARSRGWLNPKTVVVFPEYIGSWLVLVNEKTSIYEAPTAQRALTTYVFSNFFTYLRAWFTTPDEAKDKVRHSVFASKGQTMASLYQEVFSGLAREYRISIIAGSILLPNPEFHKGHIDTWKGSLYNVSAVFDTAGRLQPALARKAFPISDEQPFVGAGKTREIPSFNLPAGKTSVLVCADSWYPAAYDNIRKDDPLIVAVPSYTQADGAMSQPWSGYSGYPAPPDVDTADIGRISLRDAWLKYTLPGRLAGQHRYGMMVSLRGKMWDMGSDGEIIAISGDKVFCGPPLKGASMACLWIN
jgi:predicted amidohydrolase